MSRRSGWPRTSGSAAGGLPAICAAASAGSIGSTTRKRVAPAHECKRRRGRRGRARVQHRCRLHAGTLTAQGRARRPRQAAACECGASSGRSMRFNRPQPFGCGRVARCPERRARSGRLQWSRNLSVAEGLSTTASSNQTTWLQRAATFRLRKVQVYQRMAVYRRKLQRDRNLSVAEGGCAGGGECRHIQVSTGPRPFGCGRASPAASLAGTVHGFNRSQHFGCGGGGRRSGTL